MKGILRILADIKYSSVNISELKFKNMNWEYILNFFSYHELLPLLYYNFKKNNLILPSDIKNPLKQNYYISCTRNMILLSEFLNIKKLFEKQKISFVPLKGIDFISTLYPDLNLRSISDIDLLIERKQIDLAQEVLLKMGYKKILGGMRETYWLKHHCHFIYGKSHDSGINIYLELHWALDFRRVKNIKIEALWHRARNIKIENEICRAMSPEDTLISLTLHQRRFHKPLILKNILDAKLLLETNFKLDWHYIIQSAYKYRFRASLNLFLNELEIFFQCNLEPFKKKLRILNIVNRAERILIEHSIYNLKFLKDREYQKRIYFKLCFFLYDSCWESFLYLSFFLPQEKFAKFFNLKPYELKTSLFYRMRFIYIPWRFFTNHLKRIMI